MNFDATKLNDPKTRAAWDFEFGLHMASTAYTFYDTDNDGQIDVILTDADRDKMADIVLKCIAGTWQATSTTGVSMFAPGLFEDEQLEQRYIEFGLPLHQPPDNADEPAEKLTPDAPSEPST